VREIARGESQGGRQLRCVGRGRQREQRHAQEEVAEEECVSVAWDDLPESVRRAVQWHIGPVAEATEVTGGQNHDVAAVLHRSSGPPVFLKGVEGVSGRMRTLRNESTAGRLAAGVAPTVLFVADVKDADDWLVVGFEYLPGRPVDLAPGSADLPLVADTHAAWRLGMRLHDHDPLH
jgi:hypothetical protein